MRALPVVLRLDSPLRQLAHLAIAAVVLAMAAWNVYICLRLRPDAPTILINLAFLFVPMLALFALTGRMWRSVALGTAAVFILQRLFSLKWKYLAVSWSVTDLRFLSDSANWVVLRQYPELLAFAVGCLAVLAGAWFLSPLDGVRSWRGRGVAAILAAALIGGSVMFRNVHTFDPFGHNIYGHFANLLFSASTIEYQPPVVEASSALFVSRASTVPPPDSRAASPPSDIVVWLQESTMNLRVLDLPGASLPVQSMYEPSPSVRQQGWLRVHAWGGSTWLTEFALLSGLHHQDFGPSGNGVYYTATPHLTYSLPKLLKRSGYYSIAISGSPKAIYNMETAQRQLGFDEVLNPLDFPEWGGKSLATNFVDDAQLAQFANQVLARHRDKRVFLFVLSIIQHGPYDPKHPIDYGLDRTGLDRATAARLSDYTNRLVATDAVNHDFGAGLLRRSKPVTFAYFGDHHPNLDGTVPFRRDLNDPKYLTSYAIKTNFESPVAESAPGVLDISFLAGVVLERAGVPLDDFFKANRAMRLLCDGRLVDCPDHELRRSYNAYLYGDLGAAVNGLMSKNQ